MMITRYFLVFTLLGMFGVSCKKDNYAGPNAELYGTFIDKDTREPVAQDIINGTVIELIEHGWVEGQTNITQTLVAKGDGTYRNSDIFSGKYLIRAVRGNFQNIPAIDTFEIKKGSNELNFEVTPYIRVKEPSIVKNGNIVTATFKLEQTTTQNVSRIGLYVHPNPNVGQPMKLVFVEQTLNRVTTPGETFTITLDMAAGSNTDWKFLRPGEQYYFRIGALSSATSAKYNYAPAVRLTR
jgi:hypothetical protein